MVTIEAIMYVYALAAVGCAWGFVRGVVTDTGKFDYVDLIIVVIASLLWPLSLFGILVGKMLRT